VSDSKTREAEFALQFMAPDAAKVEVLGLLSGYLEMSEEMGTRVAPGELLDFIAARLAVAGTLKTPNP
jgi:hypothetical protein